MAAFGSLEIFLYFKLVTVNVFDLNILCSLSFTGASWYLIQRRVYRQVGKFILQIKTCF